MARLLSVLVLAFALAGCGSDSGNNEAASTSPSTNPSSPPAMKTTEDCAGLSDSGLHARMSPAIENRETMYLTDVTLSGDDCDRQVIFSFEEQKPGPGFEVSYQPASSAKVEDASGNPVAIAGDAFLVVKLTPAMTAKIDGDQVTKTYTGPKRLETEADSPVKDVVKTGDFESVVTWVIGLNEKRPFKTNATDSSLVVEIDNS